MKHKVLSILIFISMVGIAVGQWTNFRIFPSGNVQIEPSIVTHPTNENIMFVASFTISQSLGASEGWYITTNGGTTWFGSDQMPGTNHGGDPGPVIDKNGRFILTHRGVTTGLFSNYTDNFGGTWSPTIPIATGTDIDKISSTTDAVLSSSYYGRTYVTWTRFTGSIPIIIAWTTNGAESWSSQVQVNNSQSGHSSLGPFVEVGPTGQVYATWASVVQGGAFNEDCIGFAVSSNGGANWTVQECAYDCNGIKASSLGGNWNFRVNGYPFMDVDNTGGSRNGWIYIVTGEKNLAPAGSDPDVIFHRSTNGGQTWSQGIRVNQDALNNGKVQYFPAIEVDDVGGLSVVYFDNRSAPPAGDSMGFYLSRSVDGGNNWTDYRVNDHWFRPTGGGLGGNQGDNIGITSANGKLWPVWMDNSTGNYQIWTASILISTIGIKQISTEVPDGFRLHQNYPNPFNPGTKIRFDLPSNVKRQTSDVKLIIFDVLGRELAILVNESLKPGTYEVEFDAGEFPSAIYLYQLITGEYTETRKMVLVK